MAAARAQAERTVRGYVAALSARDVAKMRQYFPGLSKQTEDGLQRTFDAARDFSATLLSVDVSSATEDSADVLFAYQLHGWVRGTGDLDKALPAQRVRAALKRTAAGWQMQTVALAK